MENTDGFTGPRDMTYRVFQGPLAGHPKNTGPEAFRTFSWNN